MTTDEALDRINEVDCDGKPLYPIGSVAKTLATEVVGLRVEREQRALEALIVATMRGIDPEELDKAITAAECENCGACCFEQGSPPAYGCLVDADEQARKAWPDQADNERVETLPADAINVLLDYWEKLKRGEVDGDGPCCWLDQETNRCRFYEFRPQICRDLDVCSEGCRIWRERQRRSHDTTRN
jgi:Fe-S-cluster containining protein